MLHALFFSHIPACFLKSETKNDDDNNIKKELKKIKIKIKKNYPIHPQHYLSPCHLYYTKKKKCSKGGPKKCSIGLSQVERGLLTWEST